MCRHRVVVRAFLILAVLLLSPSVTWSEGNIVGKWIEDSGNQILLFTFYSGGELTIEFSGGSEKDVGRWRQEGNRIEFTANCSAPPCLYVDNVYTGLIVGDRIVGKRTIAGGRITGSFTLTRER